MIKRTHTCGELNVNNQKNIVSLCGWISKRRDHGGLIFIDLRDRYGKTQVVFNEDINLEAFNAVKKLGLEDVIGIDTSSAVSCYGKTGEGISEIIEQIILTLPGQSG